MSEGEMLVDHYQLTNCIATGTYSQIWEVTDQETSEHFAMKLLRSEAREDPEQLKAFRHEVKLAKTFDHPNFVKIHGSAISKKRAYFVMDFFRAPNVKVLISSDLVLVQERIGKLVESVCSALGHMHEKGWVHRDVKPDNILFSKGSELRLIDFSLSTRIVAGLGKVFAGKIQFIQGTRTYIAPETIRKQHAVPQTDMYSLGVTLYEILTGEPPIRGRSPDELLRNHLREEPAAPSIANPNVTKEMDRLVLRLLSKKPEQRFKDMQELFSDFRSIKVFHEPPADYAAKTQQKADDVFQDSLANRLNSRADAERAGQPTSGEKPAAAKRAAAPQPAAKPKPKPAPAKPARVAQPAAAQPPQFAPQPGAYFPQPMPQYFAPMPMPQQMPQQMPYPMPGGMPFGAPPAPPAPAQPQPPRPQPAAQSPAPAQRPPAAAPPPKPSAPQPSPPKPAAEQPAKQPPAKTPPPPKAPEQPADDQLDIDSFTVS